MAFCARGCVGVLAAVGRRIRRNRPARVEPVSLGAARDARSGPVLSSEDVFRRRGCPALGFGRRHRRSFITGHTTHLALPAVGRRVIARADP